MNQTTNQIEAYIEATRDDLGANLKELEAKVKSVTDWKQQFQSNPMTMIGVAFGGGIVLAAMLGGKTRTGGERRPMRYINGPESPAGGGSGFRHPKAVEAWDTFKGALIGVAATRFKDFVGEVIPGFTEQLRRGDHKANSL